jgi:hypothetical protein
LPSDRAGNELRAVRPTDEPPIGGLDAAIPNATLPVMAGFVILAEAVALYRKRKTAKK